MMNMNYRDIGDEFLEFLDELETEDRDNRYVDEDYFLWRLRKAVFQEEIEDE